MVELTRNIDERLDEAKTFLSKFQTVMLASCDTLGHPDASYAPFVRRSDNCFYVYISGLARHTGNLISTHRASLLFIQEESASAQLFARTRMTFACNAQLVARQCELAQAVMSMMHAKFGKVVDMIAPLPDFRIIKLSPYSCTYVTGFANAFHFSKTELAALSDVHDKSD